MRTLIAVALLAGSPVYAQSVISAQSGMIHYVEGHAFVDGKLTEPKFGEFPNIKENSIFRTEEGRSEVLLSPGVFLRVSENSSFKMLSTKLSDTRVELLSGSILVESAEENARVASYTGKNETTFLYKDQTVTFHKTGLYRLDTDPAQLRVYKGEALLTANGQSIVVKEGREVALDGMLVASKFDNKTGDALYRWSKRRASYLATANVSAAKSLLDSGTSWSSSGWRYNSLFGLFTFVPYGGMYASPFGYSFYGPRSVGNLYYRPVYTHQNSGGYGGGYSNAASSSPHYDSNAGYVTMGRSNNSTYSPAASAPSAPAASAPVASGDGGASRGSSGGGSRGR